MQTLGNPRIANAYTREKYRRYQGMIALSLTVNIKRLKSDPLGAIQEIGADLQDLLNLPKEDRKHQCKTILAFLGDDELRRLQENRGKILGQMKVSNVMHPIKQRLVHPAELIQDYHSYQNTAQILTKQASTQSIESSKRSQLYKRADLAEKMAASIEGVLEEWLDLNPDFRDLLGLSFAS
ncbi:MAG: hypothetical protein QNJ46_15490 [Leptolyngbyaceae cyanobacterium MO_188.B28]|nr:hypothetical protein [Leptolyngbyaceae cyanobacterium MO_188.B28]